MKPTELRAEAQQYLDFLYSTIRNVLRPKALFKIATTSPAKRLILDVIVLSLCSSLLLILTHAILSSVIDLSGLFSGAAFLALFSVSFFLVFVGVFAFSRLSFKRLIGSSVFFSAHSVIAIAVPSFIVLFVYIASEYWALYYLYYVFLYVPLLIFVFTYPLIFNRGIYKVLSLLISIVCFIATNLAFSVLVKAFPSEYDNSANYIYDPIVREYIGNNLLEEAKTEYIDTNALMLFKEFGKLKNGFAADTLRTISAQIGAITSQKDHLTELLGRLHFRRSKKLVELNLSIIDTLSLINIQVNRMAPVPPGYADMLRSLDLRQKEISRGLAAHDERLKQYSSLQEEYKKRITSLLSITKPNEADAEEARQLREKVNTLIAQIDAEALKAATLKKEMTDMQSDNASAARTGLIVETNNNAMTEINHLMEVLGSDVRKGSEYSQEQLFILHVRAYLPFFP